MAPHPDAWHEAGHAVVAHLLGGQVRGVSLECDEDEFEGRAEVLWQGLARAELLRCTALVAFAGPLFELELGDTDAADDASLQSSWRLDEQEAERALAELEPDPERRAGLRLRLVSEVRDLARDPVVREHVLRVAEALDAHGSLDETLFADALGE